MLWPTGLSNDFTICSLTRYTGGANKRVLAGLVCNWLHGHFENKRGVSHFNGWRTLESSRGTVTDWLVMCGQNSASSSTATPNNIIGDGNILFINCYYDNVKK
jgi:hypothetical protein